MALSIGNIQICVQTVPDLEINHYSFRRAVSNTLVPITDAIQKLLNRDRALMVSQVRATPEMCTLFLKLYFDNCLSL